MDRFDWGVVLVVGGFLVGAWFADLSHPACPKISYSEPVMKDYDKADLDFFKAMREMK